MSTSKDIDIAGVAGDENEASLQERIAPSDIPVPMEGTISCISIYTHAGYRSGA